MGNPSGGVMIAISAKKKQPGHQQQSPNFPSCSELYVPFCVLVLQVGNAAGKQHGF